MDVCGVVERVRRVADVRADDAAGPDSLQEALRASAQITAWLAATNAELTRRLRPQVSFPDKAVADCTRGSLHDAIKGGERADTLAAVPEMATALDDATVTPSHIDELTRATKGLDADQRAELFERAAGLVPVAAAGSVREFAKRLQCEVRNIRGDDGLGRLERQRRATSMQSWLDAEGMHCHQARFDPVTGVRMMGRLDAEVQAIRREGLPDTCPSDPIEQQRHLYGLALARLVLGCPGAATTGRPEYVVVIEASQPDGNGGPLVDWGIPVEVPTRVLADLLGDDQVDVHVVTVRNGVVLHAPGALNLGRSSRLANRAQRRALNALYATCAVPGCAVHYRYTRLHHIHQWEHGGSTDLANLLPLCAHHHAMVHRLGWRIVLGPHRELAIHLPDGTILTTGPPRRHTA